MKKHILVILAAAISATASPRTQTQTPPPATFAIGGGELIAAEHGSFTVPAVRPRVSPALTLRYVRFKSSAINPGPPIVFLAGGPGDAATRAFQGMPRRAALSMRAVMSTTGMMRS